MLKLWRRPGAKQGIWRIRGTVGGHRYDESTGTDSRAHAEIIFARRQKEILDAVVWGPERTTCFAEAVEVYVKGGGEVRFLEPLVRAFGERRLADIKQADVLSFIARQYPTTGPHGINRQVFTPLIAIFNAANEAGMGPPPSFTRPKLPKKAMVRFATDEHINAVLPHASPRLVGAIMLMTLGGARASEACRVTEIDVGWDAGTVVLQETKNGEPAVIHAGDRLMAALRPLRGSGDPLFGFASRFSLNQAIERACLRAGVPVYTSHEIGRHAFAARHLARGRTLLEVQKLGRWKSYRMVAEVYGHLEQSRLDQEMRDAGGALVVPENNIVVLPMRKRAGLV